MKRIFELASMCLFMFLFSGLAVVLHGQTGVAEGTVIDADTKKPIAKAKVTIVNKQSANVSFELLTDEKGRFYKGGLIIGGYTVNAEKEGYLPTSGSIRAQQGEPARLDIKLKSVENIPVGPAKASSAAGFKLLNAGNYTEAIEKLAQAISEDPAEPSNYYYRGKAYEKTEQYDKALADYQKTLELKADFILAISGMGNVYVKQRDYEKALEHYKKALDLGDKDVATRFNYGAALVSAGKGAEAVAVYEELIFLNPNYSEAYYQLGIVYINLNETPKAIQALEKFIVMDPQNPKVTIAQEIVKTLKSGSLSIF